MAQQPDPVQAALEQLNQVLANGGGQLPVNPIGVPSVLRDPESGQTVPFTGGSSGLEARYFDGDEWGPSALKGDEIARLQLLLIDAGFIPRGATFAKGKWDEVSRAAYRDVLAQANGSGMNPQQVMAEFASAPREARPQQQLKLDPASMRASVRGHVEKLLGREVTDDELPDLVGIRSGLGQQELDASQSTADVVQAVDSEARFEDYLRDRYRPEIDRNRGVLDMTQSRESLMGNIFALDEAIA